MIDLLLTFLPSEYWLIALMFAGVLLIIGQRRIAKGIFLTIILMALLGPIIESLFVQLPLWIQLVLMILVVLSIVKTLLGEAIFSHLAAIFLWNFLCAPFKLMAWLIKRPARRV